MFCGIVKLRWRRRTKSALWILKGKTTKKINRVEEELKSGFLVGKALEMGFQKWKIKRVSVDCFKSHNLNYSNFREFLDALVRIGECEKEDDRVALTPKEALKILRDSGLCKKSKTNKKNVLFFSL